MIRIQVGSSGPIEVVEASDVLRCLQKYIQLGHAYAINILDEAEGTLIVIADYEADKDSTVDL